MNSTTFTTTIPSSITLDMILLDGITVNRDGGQWQLLDWRTEGVVDEACRLLPELAEFIRLVASLNERLDDDMTAVDEFAAIAGPEVCFEGAIVDVYLAMAALKGLDDLLDEDELEREFGQQVEVEACNRFRRLLNELFHAVKLIYAVKQSGAWPEMETRHGRH